MSVNAASLSCRISASRAAAASNPHLSAAPNGSPRSAARASSAAASRSSRYANNAAASPCSLLIAAAYAPSHTAVSSGVVAAPSRRRIARRTSGASFAAAARSSRANPDTSPRVIRRSGAHRRRNRRASSGAATSSLPGKEDGATGPHDANTTARSSSWTRESWYARRSFAAATAADMSISREPTSRRTRPGARLASDSETATPSSERRLGRRASTCAR